MYGNEARGRPGPARLRPQPRRGLPHDEALAHRARAAACTTQLEQSLRDLRTEYVDLLLIHWPSRERPARRDARRDGRGARRRPRAPPRRRELPDARCCARRSSTRRSICDQVEYHPYLGQPAVLALARERDLMVTAYSPLAQGAVLRDPRARARSPRRTARAPARSSCAGCSTSRTSRRSRRRRATSTAPRTSTSSASSCPTRSAARSPASSAAGARSTRPGRPTGTEPPGDIRPAPPRGRSRACARTTDATDVFDIDNALCTLVQLGGSDLHLKVKAPAADPRRRRAAPDRGHRILLTPEDTEAAVRTMLQDPIKLTELAEEFEVDFSYSISGVARFRVNAFRQRGTLSLVCPRDPAHDPHGLRAQRCRRSSPSWPRRSAGSSCSPARPARASRRRSRR